MNFLSRLFGLDSRALACARILCGGVLLGDLLLRLRYASDFYSDRGVFPRETMMSAYRSVTLPSLHLANDLAGYQIVLLLLQVAIAGALVAGYQTRPMSVASWYLLVSLHERNPLVLNSGDTLLAALLFWGMFLPWGERWSVDSKSLPERQGETVIFSAATIGWCMQMCCLYLFAALHKLHPYWLGEGSAVYYALSLGHHASAWSGLLLAHPDLLPGLTRSVLALEFLLSLAIFSPWMRPRIAVLALAAVMHLGFGLFLEIGIFRYVPLVGLVALMPSAAFRQTSPPTLSVRLGVLPAAPLLAICLLTIGVNLESLGKGKPLFLPAPLMAIAPAFSSLQYFGVFAGPGLERGGWFSVQVAASDGKTYDAWRGDRPFSEQPPPKFVAGTYPDDRWRKFMMNLATLPPGDPIRERFARYCLEQWNLRHRGNPARHVRIWNAVAITPLHGPPEPPEWRLLSEARP